MHLGIDPVSIIRFTIFALVLFLLMSLEWLIPRRMYQPRGVRWFSNLSISAINILALALLSLSAVAASLFALEYKWGLFYVWNLPLWPQIFIAIIILDLVVYWQHRLFHTRGIFWAIHRMHHTDNMVDVTTALRFHPLEIIISMLIKCLTIVLLGAPLLGVIIFEILLNVAAMFNHSNVKLPLLLDKVLRMVVVTPDMHRVHHSQTFRERNTNYGFFLSFWDRIFVSYCAQPELGHEKMRIGLKQYQQPKQNYLPVMLIQPWRKSKQLNNKSHRS